MRSEPDDDLVPVSVRLGEVVPPEDPEDWTRPLTWVAALGMLAGPLVAFAWFAFAPPVDVTTALPATYLVAAALAGGAAATGATQQGVARIVAATLGAALFASLLIVIFGVVTAGERQVGTASPTVAHAFTASLDGLVGAVVASLVAALARRRSPDFRFVLPVATGTIVAFVAVWTLRPW